MVWFSNGYPNHESGWHTKLIIMQERLNDYKKVI